MWYIYDLQREEQKDELVTNELKSIDDETFLCEYGFEPVEIKDK